MIRINEEKYGKVQYVIDAYKPLTECRKFIGIIILLIKGKYDCEQLRFYLKVVWEMGVLQFL